MNSILLVGLGGGLGAMARFALGLWVSQLTPGWRFPLATFLVNVVGCFVAGLLAGWAEGRGAFTEAMRLFLFVGILGGFTTFSAFGLETVTLLRRGETGIAGWYVGLSVAGGLAALWVGIWTGR